MKIIVEHHGTLYRGSLNDARSIAIELDFDGPQPNHFGADRASAAVLKLGGFVGDTRQGGSCNVKSISMIPHCNGTHTETVSHIVNEEIWIGHAAIESLSIAMLVTVDPVDANDSVGSYRPELQASDRVISLKSIQDAMGAVGDPDEIQPVALVVRTRPNEPVKASRAYTEKDAPPFFTVEAMEEIVRLKIRHLLVDFPSVDRMFDDGLLTNHHLFWNVQEGTHTLSAETDQEKTITEMIFVDDGLEDGLYLLNLQIPAFCSDAAPSRPVIIPIQATHE